MRREAGWGWLTVRLKVVWTAPLAVWRRTWTGPAVVPSVTVAETNPLASEVEVTPLSATGLSGCQTTDTLGAGFPAESTTRASSGRGNCAPAIPDWLFPPTMSSVEGWGWA